MTKGLLYNIEKHNDFYDSLHIMETMEDGDFKLIFMELPPLIKPTSYIYNLENSHKIPGTDLFEITGPMDIRSTFLCKCIENAYRLLKTDGILVLYTHKYTHSSLDYFLLLNQFFPSIKDLILCNEPQSDLFTLNTIFFCNKQKNYNFPTEMLYLSNFYPYKDELGLYRYERAFSLHTPKKGYDYTWQGIKPHIPYEWKYPSNIMDNLWNEDRIIINPHTIDIKRYRTEENIQINKNEQLLWQIPHRNYNEKGYWRTCDEISLDRIFSIYCRPGDPVFCPFDYCNLFPYMANKQDLLWTSIQSHTLLANRELFFDLSNSNYDIVTKLPNKNSHLQYRTDIITTPLDLEKFKTQINTLTTSIRTVKTVLQLTDDNNSSPFSHIEIKEDALAERFHEYISKHIASDMLDSVDLIAQKEYSDCWSKLENNSQSYIKTAIALSLTINHSDFDGSSILVELFKTLESEMYIKLFRSYAVKLKQENISMTKKYRNMNKHRETKEFWNYLHFFIRKNIELPLTLGRMNDILEKTLSQKQTKDIYIDFHKYLKSILEPSFFEKNITQNIFWLTKTRNNGVHHDLTSQEDLEKCTIIIKEKLNQLLCNLSVTPNKNIHRNTSNLTDNIHKETR